MSNYPRSMHSLEELEFNRVTNVFKSLKNKGLYLKKMQTLLKANKKGAKEENLKCTSDYLLLCEDN